VFGQSKIQNPKSKIGMMTGSHPALLGRALLVLGLVLVVAGLWVLAGPRLPWLGRLPGDIAIRRDHFSLHVPLTTCLIISVVLSLILWLVGRSRQ
jgi:hypothetical protein